MQRPISYYIVNGLSLYRLLAAPVLVLLIIYNELDIFKWMLAISFATDAADGFLARKLKVTSKFGSKLDSIADGATLLASFTAVFLAKRAFVNDNAVIILVMFGLMILQMGIALWKFRKLTSFHTYFAKLAMLLQGCFLILLFFLPEVPYWLFFPAAIISILDLAEEIILVFLLPKSETNVKGLYWVLKRKKTHPV